jgi:hypothetical protein
LLTIELLTSLAGGNHWSGVKSNRRHQLGRLDVSRALQGVSCKTGQKAPYKDQAVTGEKQNQKTPAVTLAPDQRDTCARALTCALALVDMLPANAVPSLFRYELEQLTEKIAGKTTTLAAWSRPRASTSQNLASRNRRPREGRHIVI